MGDPLDKAIDMGAIIAPVQLQKIQELVKQGADEGATMWQPSWSCPNEGLFFPPTLFTNVAPASNIAQVEIFGPVLVSMTFRTSAEAVALANNTCYGLAASVWSENINRALDVAPKLKAGTVWINSTNLFDAASGFGGYRESGFGREGGKEGLWEYVRSERESGRVGDQPSDPTTQRPNTSTSTIAPTPNPQHPTPTIDRTPKLYIGGKQVRPDSGYSIQIHGPNGELQGEVGDGNRKDIRNAVEAAHAAEKWARQTAHNRAQVLYYIAENLEARAEEFTVRLDQMGISDRSDRLVGSEEVKLSIQRIFTYAALADKYDGAVHSTPLRSVTLAMNEPIGVIGIVCPNEWPLLGLISTIMPAIAMGNTAVVIPSEAYPLAATDFYQVLETSDLPGGVVNIVTGKKDVMAEVLANHMDVDALWYFGSEEGSRIVEYASACNMKRTLVSYGRPRDWASLRNGEGREFLREATQMKNIWIPYGDSISG